MSVTRKPEAVSASTRGDSPISQLHGVEQVASAPSSRRDPGFAAQFTAEGYRKANGEEDPRAQFRTVSPGFFAALGVRLIAGRDFNDGDRRGGERVVIVSQSLAARMFPNLDAVNRRLMWTDPVTKFIGVSNDARRIVGVVPDIDDQNVVPVPTMTVYHPMEQEFGGGRLFVHARMDPYPLVPSITKVIRDLASDQPVERPATLDVSGRGVVADGITALVVTVSPCGARIAVVAWPRAGIFGKRRTRESGCGWRSARNPSR